MTHHTKLKHLFTPMRIKTMELKNRIAMAPMGTLMAAEDGNPSERLTHYYELRAKGGAGLIMVEDAAAHVSTAFGMGEIGVAAMYDDKFIHGWTKFNERIHAAGAKTSIQIWHPGRQSPAMGPDKPPIAPSVLPCPCPTCQDLPHEMSIAEIEEMIESFAQAARRVKESGFDAVEIGGAHGYLVAQFMSAYSNRRTDKYGGDLRSRMRFALEIVSSVRAKVGPDFPIIFRFSADEVVLGGRNLDESLTIAPWLVAAGVDCLHVSMGVYANVNTITVAPSYVPKGYILRAAQEIKKAVSIPVMAVGKLNDPLVAEEAVAQGRADLVAIGRGFFADPDWAKKAAAGDLEDIRWCTGCMQGCIHTLMTAYTTKCQVNPEVGREQRMAIVRTDNPKRVLVIGGGPAGMEAAKVAAMRGHQVTLYEKEAELGGQFRLASVPQGKQEILPYLKYQARQLEKNKVTVVLGKEAGASTLAELKPDVVVVATGGKPKVPDIPGIRGQNVVTAQDVLAFKAITGKKVLVAGGGMVGCETAHLLTSYGRDVTIVEMLPELAGDMVPGPRYYVLQSLAEHKVRAITSASILSITPDGVTYSRDGQTETIGGMNTIVLAMGTAPSDELAKQLEGKVSQVHVIGDAQNPTNAMEAIAAGAQLGRAI